MSILIGKFFVMHRLDRVGGRITGTVINAQGEYLYLQLDRPNNPIVPILLEEVSMRAEHTESGAHVTIDRFDTPFYFFDTKEARDKQLQEQGPIITDNIVKLETKSAETPEPPGAV